MTSLEWHWAKYDGYHRLYGLSANVFEPSYKLKMIHDKQEHKKIDWIGMSCVSDYHQGEYYGYLSLRQVTITHLKIGYRRWNIEKSNLQIICGTFGAEGWGPGARPTDAGIFDRIRNSAKLWSLLVTTKFCTRHDSVTVVTCAKFRFDRQNILRARALHNFIEFRSKYR